MTAAFREDDAFPVGCYGVGILLLRGEQVSEVVQDDRFESRVLQPPCHAKAVLQVCFSSLWRSGCDIHAAQAREDGSDPRRITQFPSQLESAFQASDGLLVLADGRIGLGQVDQHCYLPAGLVDRKS